MPAGGTRGSIWARGNLAGLSLRVAQNKICNQYGEEEEEEISEATRLAEKMTPGIEDWLVRLVDRIKIKGQGLK